MPTKPLALPDGKAGVGQANNRYPDTYYDQHKNGDAFPNGRPWWGHREFAANKGDRDDFCTSLYPGEHKDDERQGSVWHAPWYPETRFFEMNHARGTIRIRYDYIYQEDKAAYDRYFQAAAKLAAANGWGEVDYGKTPKYQITAILGDPPRSPKIAQAAMAGDRWLLGFTDEVNEELARLLGLSAHGIKMGEPREGVVKADVVLAASGADLDALIAAAVAKALEAERAKHPKRGRKAKQSPAVSDAA